MPAYIHTIQTAVPDNCYTQEFARDFMKTNISDNPAVSRILHRIYTMSDINKRHCVIEEFNHGKNEGIFFDESNGLKNPGTYERNELFTKESKPLFVNVGKKLLNESKFKPEEITDVITVSCTGFFNPGPDYFVVKSLGLAPTTNRYHLGFMGCYAAFPALRLAKNICNSNPDAVVMVISVELCTLHLKYTTDTDALLSASVFADGGAGAIVSSKSPKSNSNAFEISSLDTNLTPTGEEDMAWTIGNNGFEMVLSTYVPDIIQSNIKDLLAPYLTQFDKSDFKHWAIHPGGRAILDKIQNSLNLSEEQLAPSRKTLFDYGNMSSATILFVLKEILEEQIERSHPIISMAFGPGLTVESAIFNLLPAKLKEKEILQSEESLPNA